MLPDANGIEVLRWVRERRPDLAVVMITAHGSIENAVAAMKAGRVSLRDQAVQQRRGPVDRGPGGADHAAACGRTAI